MWVWEEYYDDFTTDIDNATKRIMTGKRLERHLIWKDDPEPKESKPTNCKNCGAPLTGTKCEYCGTEYAPTIEKPHCEKAEDLIKIEKVTRPPQSWCYVESVE